MPSTTQNRLLTETEKFVCDRYNVGESLAAIAAALSSSTAAVTANQISATISRLATAAPRP